MRLEVPRGEADEADEQAVVESFDRPGGVPIVAPAFQESLDLRVALGTSHGAAGEVLAHLGVGVHRRERHAVRVLPAAEQEPRRAQLGDARHRAIFSHRVGILGL